MWLVEQWEKRDRQDRKTNAIISGVLAIVGGIVGAIITLVAQALK